jgi:hypothetical protein
MHMCSLLHAVPSVRRTGTLNAATSTALTPLFDFEGTGAENAISAWERIDDVIMGGVSSSKLSLDETSAIFEGRLRSEGGGFCGQRMRLLAEPVDLSDAGGLALDVRATDAGADPSKRVWKVAIRTKQDRGEVVYQAMFEPPRGGRSVVKLPFDSFRLVRGPRLVPGVPPLSAADTKQTFQISLVVSKFTVSEDGSALPGFEEGPFALRLFSVGTYNDGASSAPSIGLPRPLTKEEQEAAAPLMLRMLRPLADVLFGEGSRRRRAATKLLIARGTGRVQRAKLGWSWRARAHGTLDAARITAGVALRGAAGAALSIPLRLLFKIIFTTLRAVKKIRNTLTGVQEPKLPPLKVQE